jgi:DNA repair protein RecO (recombination protein O)
MRNYRVRGLILKRFNYGEADRFIWLLTRDRGLLQVKAKSVRKIKAKLKGPLELFTLSDIELAKGRSLDTVTGATIVESYNNIRTDLGLTSKAFYFSEYLLNFLTENEPTKAYRLAVDSLGRLNSNREEKFLVLSFIVNLLEITGFTPELDSCLECDQEISSERIGFDFKGGGLVCSECHSNLTIKLNERTVKLIRLLRSGKENIKVDRKYVEQGEQALEKFAETIIEKKINSNRFLGQIRNA